MTVAPLIELRQYLLHSGRRDDLIELFDRELLETQEATGMDVLGQFRDLDRSDYFVWLRGFTDMAARHNSLTAFYDGPVWAKHRDTANAAMINSDDVLLLRPISPSAGFRIADAPARDHDRPKGGVIVTIIQHRKPGRESEFNAFFQATLQSKIETSGARTIGVYETDPSENTFPRLPVHDGNVLVWFGAFDTPDQLESSQQIQQWWSAWPAITQMARNLSRLPPNVLRLAPTSRSRLDGTATGVHL